MGASKNSEFAQMQGAGKISPRRMYSICKQEIFSRNAAVGMKCGFFEVPIFRYTYPQSYLCLRGFYVWSKFNEPDWSIFDAYQ
jgi:hypothetical protein